jgi:uncharacterized protein YihD (DUF1040 family)
MRSVNRIKRILSKLSALWEKEPDTRLGQLLSNLANQKSDLFYLEDEELEAAIDKEIQNMHSHKKID